MFSIDNSLSDASKRLFKSQVDAFKERDEKNHHTNHRSSKDSDKVLNGVEAFELKVDTELQKSIKIVNLVDSYYHNDSKFFDRPTDILLSTTDFISSIKQLTYYYKSQIKSLISKLTGNEEIILKNILKKIEYQSNNFKKFYELNEEELEEAKVDVTLDNEFMYENEFEYKKQHAKYQKRERTISKISNVYETIFNLLDKLANQIQNDLTNKISTIGSGLPRGTLVPTLTSSFFNGKAPSFYGSDEYRAFPTKRFL